MPIGTLRTSPLIALAVSGVVLSSVAATPVKAGVVEQLANSERFQPVDGKINVDASGFLSPEDLLEGPVVVAIAGKAGWFDFNVPAPASNLIGSVELMEILARPPAPIPPEPNPRAAAGGRVVDQGKSAPAPPVDATQPFANHYAAVPIGAVTAPAGSGSHDQFVNGDVAPEFKAIYRIASSDVDAAAPWIKPIYRAVDSAFQGNTAETVSSPSQNSIRSFDDEDWFVSRFVKFFLSRDSIPYLLLFFVVCSVVAGLLRLLGIAAPSR